MRSSINITKLYWFITGIMILYKILDILRTHIEMKIEALPSNVKNLSIFSDLERSWAIVDRNLSASSLSQNFNFSINQKFTILFLSYWHAYDPATFLKIPECDDEFEITSNKLAIDRADAVVFSYAVFDHMKNDYLSYTHSAIRNPNVAFILSIQESEHHNYPMMPTKFDGIFNFIWMFRREAHIHPEFQEMYGKYEKPDEKWNYGSDFSYEFLKAKTKLAAWVVTNCNIQPGGRNEFVEQLIKHGIFVDIYGKCGNHSCEGNYTENNCFPRLGKEYKFYMALENSLCLDYITEKPAHGWENGMIPIIWGVGKKELAAPPGSYIDALEFKTIEELAERIKYLDKNPREYFKYFEWRQLYNTTLSYHAAFHCYAWRKIKELTMELRANVTVNTESAIGIKNLEFWRAYFYNDKLKLNCKNCVEEGVNVTHPNMNLYRLYNNVSKCVETLN